MYLIYEHEFVETNGLQVFHPRRCCMEMISRSDMLARLSYLRSMNYFKHSSYTAIVQTLFGADGRLSTLAYINANLLSILRPLLRKISRVYGYQQNHLTFSIQLCHFTFTMYIQRNGSENYGQYFLMLQRDQCLAP